MVLTILGEHPFATDRHGKLKSRIATLFPQRSVLVTVPGIHATQRWHYLDWLKLQRAGTVASALSAEEESEEWGSAVDLIVEEDRTILIRPDPDRMALALQADEQLQELAPKHKIRFLHVLNPKVRDAIKRRGECWRITPLPTSPREMQQMIAGSRIGLTGREIYYYNRTTGTRLLTCEAFCRLGALGDGELRKHLAEIREYSATLNPHGHPEVAFFAAGDGFTQMDFAPHEFEALDSSALRRVYASLCEKFVAAVPAELRYDDFDSLEWRNRIFVSLIGQGDELVAEEALLGLSSEYFMQIRWLPGALIEEGELIVDPIFDAEFPGGEAERAAICDDKARDFIYNFVREYGDLEYVNIGRVENSLSRSRPAPEPRRVYIAELKLRSSPQEIIHVIRMQKWGVREHLDEGKFLPEAMMESEEYTQYTLDRRLGCQQLGMVVPPRMTSHKICETYVAPWTGPLGITIWSPYFERDYIRGIATDKMPRHRFQDRTFARKFACLLGQAAAPNIIVGRCDNEGHVLFDDGDEVVIEDEQHMPERIIVADQTGTFCDFRSPLHRAAPAYADPINRRIPFLADPEEFARHYLEAFLQRFLSVQAEYRRRRRAFDQLFIRRRWDPGGSFAYRWVQVLKRLDATDPRELVELIHEASAVKVRGLSIMSCPTR